MVKDVKMLLCFSSLYPVALQEAQQRYSSVPRKKLTIAYKKLINMYLQRKKQSEDFKIDF